MSQITALTSDYDAIERAIRETSRGRWFLACYLERNRSSETHMLLNAIRKLEFAMRDNGQIIENLSPLDLLWSLREMIVRARSDMAQIRESNGAATPLPLPRFSFEDVPAQLAEKMQTIKDAAAQIQNAASALRSAGVFNGVSGQVADYADIIARACESQQAALQKAERMATLVSELEAELMGVFDQLEDDCELPVDEPSNVHSFFDVFSKDPAALAIPDEVMEELSAALAAEEASRES